MATNNTRELIVALTQEKVSTMTLDSIAEAVGLSSSGTVQYHLKKLGWSTGGKSAESAVTEKPARPRKAKGVLPKRIETWLIGKARDAFVELGNDADDFEGVEITPEYVENYVLDDTPAWNILMGKIAKGEEEFAAFEAWLGTPCTMFRREMIGAEERIAAEKAERLAMLTRENESAAMFAAYAKHAGFAVITDDFGMLFVTQNWPKSWAVNYH